MKIKNLNFAILLLAIALSTVSSDLFAQRGQGKQMNREAGHEHFMGKQGHGMHQRIPGITDEQQEKMKTLRTKHMKEMTTFRNNLDIKRAELKALQTADNADMKAINKKIDEMGSIKTQMAKKRAAHRQEVRSMLSDDQKVFFDAHAGKHRKGKGHRNGQRMQRGHGNHSGECQFNK